MNSERWQKVKGLFDAALALAPEKRGKFLKNACGSDDELRREVENLLDSFDNTEGFMDKPAAAEIAGLIVERVEIKEKIKSGESIAHYEIIRQIGAGGMGEVYLAKDQKLDRKVAVKFLNEKFSRDESNLRRFTREATAASALNHPNILVVHEIGEAGDVHFIVSEFVEGKTLREISGKSPLRLTEVLDISIQIANALCTAHEARIVHRDIKPENIIVRPDGFVKILDFGLAKLIEQEPIGFEDTTIEQNETAKGVILGTVNYMSPEQAKGEQVDKRTDIFSFGVLLYEMIVGRTPFAGNSMSETLANLINTKPQPLSRFVAEVPDELQRIVSKTLRKNKDERYQTMKGLLGDLKELKENLAFDKKLERSASPDNNATAILQATTGGANLQTAETQQHTFSQKIKQHKPAAFAALAAFVIALAIVGYFAFFAASPITSVAVLPFENGSNDANLEYLSDGLSESLIDRLAQLPQLKVIARNSSFRYKGRQVDLQEIANALGVQAIVTGRVVQRGDNLSVRVEMIDVRENRQLWSEQYNRKLSDIQAVQQDIVQTVSEKLRLRLTGEEQKSLTKRYTDNTEAYQLFLKCNYYWHRFTPEAERTAADYCTQAIIKDPNFVLPYEALARSYSVMANNGWTRPHDVYPKAKAAVAKALELDPNNVVVHDAMAANLMFYDWDWAAAESEFKRAIEIDPDYWHPHELYAYLLTAQGRADEAIAEAKRAQEIDPLSLIAHASAGYPFYFSRQYDSSIEQQRKALELDPGFVLAHLNIARNLVQQGKYEEAIAGYKQSFNVMGRTSQLVGELGHAYAVSGKRAEALKLLDELKEMSGRQYISPLDFAFIYTGLGDKQQALDYLEKAYQERSTWLMWIKVDPRFDPLRSEPRFQNLLRRMNLL